MKRIIVLILTLMLLTTGCTAKPKALTDSVRPSGAMNGEAVSDYTAVNEFAYKLFGEALKNGGENVVLSPLSAYLCLAMVQNGAGGDTLREFEALLGADTKTLNALSRALMAALMKTEGGTQLSIADSAWADDDAVKVNDDYLQAVVDYYNAEVFSADLPSDAALKAVNDWVSEKTHGLIPTLHDENYPAGTVLVLLNTLYFKAQWETPFMAENSFDDSFTLAGGETVQTPMMHMGEVFFDYFRGDGAEGVVLPYDDGKTAFVALRPAEGGSAASLAAQLTAERLHAYLNTAESTLMDLALPKFEVNYSLQMNDLLKSLGLTSVFDAGAADLSALGTSDGALYLSLVHQKVKLIVDEKGTEAAAVTEAAMAKGALMPDPLRMFFDSPFVYAVVDLHSGVPLFMGVLDNPAK